MNVAIMYSGGKDSNFAVAHAIDKGWDIKYLLSIKPTRTDCYLFHFATVENTPLQAEALGLKHHLLSCDVADPKEEAEIVRKFVAENQNNESEKVDAVVLGGTGLQATQIRSIQEALKPLGIEVFAAHSGLDHFEVLKQMLEKGLEIVITQFASEGLSPWLGKALTKDNLPQLEKDSIKYGFHIGGEGGYFDTFVTNAPTFKQRIEIQEMEKVMEDANSGHIVIKKLELVDKKKTVSLET
jgi:diphthine-ammonia ligase